MPQIQIDITADGSGGWGYDVRDRNGFLLDKGKTGRIDASVYRALHSANRWLWEYNACTLTEVVVRDWSPFNDGRRMSKDEVQDHIVTHTEHMRKYNRFFNEDEHVAMICLVGGVEVIS